MRKVLKVLNAFSFLQSFHFMKEWRIEKYVIIIIIICHQILSGNQFQHRIQKVGEK